MRSFFSLGINRTKLSHELCAEVRRFYAPLTACYADMVARLYEDRGQVEQAVNEWQVAKLLKDESIDSMACQALLKSVNANDEIRLQAQLHWASEHAITLGDDASVKFKAYDGRRKLTIGYVCAWWDSSTIRGQAIPFISRHDKSRFRIIGYSLNSCGRSITEHFDEFVVIANLSHENFAKRVRSDGIDALVEFTGFSPHHRHAAMGARCAPVQISYLNHAGTSGVANVDYVMADQTAAPPGIDVHYTETIYRLPGTFFNFNYEWDQIPDAGSSPFLRNSGVTFGCFGSQSKINDAQIYMWAQLLLRIPESRLFLRNRGLTSQRDRAFMMRRFAQWGVHEGRIRLEPGGDRYSILKDYSEVDISLDTWPYNGGNTIAESLWQGVPVITLSGDTFASRYGASLLAASGCADLVAEDLDSLIRKAQQLSEDKERLVKLRRGLRQMMKEYGFADSERFCKSWEDAMSATVKAALCGSSQSGQTAAKKANKAVALGQFKGRAEIRDRLSKPFF